VDLDTSQVDTYHDDPNLNRTDTLAAGLDRLSNADLVVAHNYIGYDRRAIKKLYPKWKEPKAFHDTYILSQMLFANELDTHSIARWGNYFGIPKPAHEDWSKLTDDMLHRCRKDTQILKKLWDKLNSQLEKFHMREAIKLEYKVYEIDSEYDYWFIDVPKLSHWLKRLRSLKALLLARIEQEAPLIPTASGTATQIFKKNGELNQRIKDFCQEAGYSGQEISGPFNKIVYKVINPASSLQVVRWLLNLGWEPDEYNYKKDKRKKLIKDESGNLVVTSPKLTGEFRGLPEHLSELLQKFNKVCHRLNTLEGYDKRRTDNKIPTFAYTCGTNTARYKHRGLVNVPKASKGVYLGRVMRSLFTVPEGYILTGADASQLESRIDGHYTTKYDGGDYAKLLLEGDVHDVTAKSLGLTRDEGKTLNYALQYGAGYTKVMKLLDCSAQEAKGIVSLYWEMRPASTALKESLVSSLISRGFTQHDDLWNSRAYIKTIDGRPIFVRSWHSLVNSLIQSTGMICMKVALCYAAREIKRRKIDARLAIFYHDEFQWIVKKGQQVQVEKILMESIKRAGEHFNLRVPLASEAKSGDSWRKTH
jgi:type II secretory pathway component PulM